MFEFIFSPFAWGDIVGHQKESVNSKTVMDIGNVLGKIVANATIRQRYFLLKSHRFSGKYGIDATADHPVTVGTNNVPDFSANKFGR